MEEDRIKGFAAEFDPQSFRLNETAAQNSVIRGPAANGWRTAAAVMRLLENGWLPLANGIIGMVGEIAWPKPTRPGDTLRAESETFEINPSRARPNQDIVKVRTIAFNQHGEQGYAFTSKVLVFRRTTV